MTSRKNNKPIITTYSDKAAVIFCTKEWSQKHREELKDMNAKWNMNLTYENRKVKGWIVSLKNKIFVEFMESRRFTSDADEILNFIDEQSEQIEKEKEKEPQYEKEELLHIEENNIYIVKYSDKSVAIFADPEWSKSNKENFKENGGKWNPNLQYGDFNGGWIFAISNKNAKAYMYDEFDVKI